MVLTIPRHLNFHQFDQIKLALDQVLRTFIKSVEIKVSPDQIGGALYQIRRPLGLVFVIYFWWLGDLLPLYI